MALNLNTALPAYLSRDFLALPNITQSPAQVGQNVQQAMSSTQAFGQQFAQGLAAANQEKLRRAQQAALEAKMPAGYTEADLVMVKAFAEKYGPPPVDAQGKYDFAAMSATLDKDRTQADSWHAWQLSKPLIETEVRERPISAWDASMAINPETGVAPEGAVAASPEVWQRTSAILPDGTKKVLSDWSFDAQGTADTVRAKAAEDAVRLKESVVEKPLSSAELNARAEASKAYVAGQDALTALNRADALLQQNASEPFVGPVLGSAAGQLWGRAKTFFGSPAQQNNQRYLETLVADSILEKAGQMKGQLSDRDVIFLKASVPKLNDTLEFWRQWIDRSRRLIMARMQESAERAGAPSTGQLLGVPDSEVDSEIQQFQQNYGPASGAGAIVPLTTVEEEELAKRRQRVTGIAPLSQASVRAWFPSPETEKLTLAFPGN